MGQVASSQRAATAAGIEILRAGGNAADGAVAVAAALAVTEPTSTGLGGDCFALTFDAATRTITALNGSGRAPARLSLDVVGNELLPASPHTVTVPGAAAGWCDLLARHGSLPLATVLGPAIALAEDGFAVGPITAYWWGVGVESLRGAANIGELTVDGRAPRAGERFRNPGMARTLRTLAAGGADAFYRGEIGAAIVEVLAASGGVMTRDDLASHVSTWDEPISTTYRDVRVWECPPNGQGLTALIALSLLEGFDLAALDPLGVDRLHLVVEALRLAFADARAYIADPRAAAVPIAELLSKDYAAARRARIDLRRAAANVAPGTPISGNDTVYFCVVDDAGNACSFINSNYMGFGTGIVPRGCGFTLQNRGHCFSLDPKHPNALAPKKRPYHTIIPAMITRRDGSLWGPFGVMGGFMQPQGHVQVVLALFDDGATPQGALDRPRLFVDSAGGVALEEGISGEAAAALSARGHPVTAGVGGFDRALFGRGQVIHRALDGTLTAGSDPRGDGATEKS